MKFFLIVAKGKKQGLAIPIEFDLFLIGSGSMCQLRAVHERLGEQHCALIQRDRKAFVCDLDSGGVTLVNEQEIPAGVEWPLHGGDRLDVGPLHFLVQFHEKDLSKRDLEEWAHSCLDQSVTRKVSGADRYESVTGSAHDDSAAAAASLILDHLTSKNGVVRGRFRFSWESGCTVVRLNDVYLVEEAELGMLAKELRDNLKAPNSKILLDMKHVRRLSSSAAEMFGKLQTWLHSHGSRFAMCRLRPEMEDLLHSFPDTKNIRCFDDKPTALKSTW